MAEDLKGKIKKQLKNGNLGKVTEILVSEFIKNPKNIDLINLLDKDFLAEDLSNELIELYRMAFYYTMDPLYFEKIGDVYYKKKEYESAVSSYLDCAEVVENYPQIYKKLADNFEKLGDKDSRQACLAQMEALSNG